MSGYAVFQGGGWVAVNSRDECPIGSTFTEVEPPHAIAQPGPNELRRAEIISRLSAIDAASVRPQREVIAALAAGDPAPAYAVDKLAALEAEAAQARLELAELGADPLGSGDA